MKKSLIILGIAFLGLSSCKKESEIVEDTLGTATISGKLTADLDLNNDRNAAGAYVKGLNPEAVEGITVSVTINTRNWDQTPDPSYTYEQRVYTATTDVNGDYSLSIPAGEKAFGVAVTYSSFTYHQVQYGSSGGGSTRAVPFSASNRSATLFAGSSSTLDVEYSEGTPSTPAHTETGSYTLKGQLRINSNVLNDTNALGNPSTTYENNFPNNLIVQVEIATGTIGGSLPIFNEVSVNSNGSFEVTVATPVDQDANTSFEIEFPDLSIDYTRTAAGSDTTTTELWERAAYNGTARNLQSDEINFNYFLK